MMLPSLLPGVIETYDPARKLARVSIPGLTDGDGFPEAEFMLAAGDKGEHTDIRVLPGDRVWLMFVNGDKRFPVIVGFRPRQTGNAVGVRRFHHDNIETDADANQAHTAGVRFSLTVGDTTIVLTPGGVSIKAANVTVDTPSALFTGNIVAVGDVIAGPISLRLHRHGGVQNGGGQTSPSIP